MRSPNNYGRRSHTRMCHGCLPHADAPSLPLISGELAKVHSVKVTHLQFVIAVSHRKRYVQTAKFFFLGRECGFNAMGLTATRHSRLSLDSTNEVNLVSIIFAEEK
jgi:hypothetical protein